MEGKDIVHLASCNFNYLWQSASPEGSVFSDCEMPLTEDDDEDLVTDICCKKSILTVINNGPLKLIDLPAELLEAILRYIPFENIGKIRLVCQHFNAIGSSMLNSEFHRLRMSMQQRFQNIKAQMPRRESARRKHPLARESDIIETLHMRLTLLHMTFAKHIERKHCCFFAGEILDEVYRILKYVKTTPSLSRAYKVTDELFDLSTMAMEYFKEHIEPTLPEITYFGTEFFDYTPSLSSSPKTQLCLLDDPSSSSTCPSKSSSVIEVLPPRAAVSPAVSKRLRKLRENMKRNNGQVVALKQELKLSKRKVANQQKQINELKSRFEDYDKKFQSTSRKLNAVLQELNRCKTELQYWRSKSPAAQCSCGKVTPVLEVKELDNLSSEVYFDSTLPKTDNDNSDEEFKPISVEVDMPSSSSDYFVVIPACHSTLTEGALMTSAPTVRRSRSKRFLKEDSDSSTESVEENVMSKSCKRKLKLDHADDKLVVKISKVQMVPPQKDGI